MHLSETTAKVGSVLNVLKVWPLLGIYILLRASRVFASSLNLYSVQFNFFVKCKLLHILKDLLKHLHRMATKVPCLPVPLNLF